jgi:hypothetical protein
MFNITISKKRAEFEVLSQNKTISMCFWGAREMNG